MTQSLGQGPRSIMSSAKLLWAAQISWTFTRGGCSPGVSVPTWSLGEQQGLWNYFGESIHVVMCLQQWVLFFSAPTPTPNSTTSLPELCTNVLYVWSFMSSSHHLCPISRKQNCLCTDSPALSGHIRRATKSPASSAEHGL